jgi:hypothetical protein
VIVTAALGSLEGISTAAARFRLEDLVMVSEVDILEFPGRSAKNDNLVDDVGSQNHVRTMSKIILPPLTAFHSSGISLAQVEDAIAYPTGRATTWKNLL